MKRHYQIALAVALILVAAGFVVAALSSETLLSLDKDTGIKCPAITVRNVTVEPDDMIHMGVVGSEPEPPTFLISDEGRDAVIHMHVRGPLLGAMHSRHIPVEVTCDSRSGTIIATIELTESRNYTGSALMNILWKPRIDLAMEIRKGDVQTSYPLRIQWVMNVDDGEVGRHPVPAPSVHPKIFPIIQETNIVL